MAMNLALLVLVVSRCGVVGEFQRQGANQGHRLLYIKIIAHTRTPSPSPFSFPPFTTTATHTHSLTHQTRYTHARHEPRPLRARVPSQEAQ